MGEGRNTLDLNIRTYKFLLKKKNHCIYKGGVREFECMEEPSKYRVDCDNMRMLSQISKMSISKGNSFDTHENGEEIRLQI